MDGGLLTLSVPVLHPPTPTGRNLRLPSIHVAYESARLNQSARLNPSILLSQAPSQDLSPETAVLGVQSGLRPPSPPLRRLRPARLHMAGWHVPKSIPHSAAIHVSPLRRHTSPANRLPLPKQPASPPSAEDHDIALPAPDPSSRPTIIISRSGGGCFFSTRPSPFYQP